jgi:hypothetical protein
MNSKLKRIMADHPRPNTGRSPSVPPPVDLLTEAELRPALRMFTRVAEAREGYDAFGLIGTIFSELDWKTLIFSRERSR